MKLQKHFLYYRSFNEVEGLMSVNRSLLVPLAVFVCIYSACK